MQIPSEQITLRKKIGKSKGKDVWLLKTKGGLNVVTVGSTIAGMGPHACVARRVAQNYEPEIQFTELSKGDYVPLDAYEHLLPTYEKASADLRALQKAEGVARDSD